MNKLDKFIISVRLVGMVLSCNECTLIRDIDMIKICDKHKPTIEDYGIDIDDSNWLEFG